MPCADASDSAMSPANPIPRGAEAQSDHRGNSALHGRRWRWRWPDGKRGEVDSAVGDLIDLPADSLREEVPVVVEPPRHPWRGPGHEVVLDLLERVVTGVSRQLPRR